MIRAGKKFIWMVSGAGVLLALLAAVALILPRVLDTRGLGRNLAAELEARYHIHSDRVKIAFLPSPRMTIFGVKTTVPDTLAASAGRVCIHARMLPLLAGRLAPSKIEVLNPMIAARLPEQAPEQTAKSGSERPPDFKDRISQIQAPLLEALSGVVIDVRNGRLELYSGEKRTFFFEKLDLKTSVHAHRVDFKLTSGKADLWQAVTFSGWVDVGTLKGSAKLNLTGGNPRDLVRYLKMPASERIGDSRIDLSLMLSAGGPKNARADFTASVPQLNFDGAPQSTAMSNGTLSGAFSLDADGMGISLSSFRFDRPRISLTASYVEKFSDQSVTLNIDGHETDAASVRSLLLAVDKDNPVIRRVFEIIRAAEVPAVLFSAAAKSPSGLMDPENFTIRGSIEHGEVFAPKADLLVSNVSANVLVQGGILEATDISGGTAGTSTKNGTLRIGLRGHNPLFHLDLPLEADLSELPDVLHRVVDNEAFKRELAQIKDVTGRATGRMVLGETLDGLTSRVESGPFHFHGRYGRVPEPVDLEGSSFFFEGSKISATSVAGKSGKSSLEGVDLNYDWGAEKLLQLESQSRSVVSMDLLGPYMRANEYWKTFLDAPPKGLLIFNSFRFSGQPSDRTNRVFKASGSVEEVVFQNRQLGSPLALKNGAFEVNGDEIVLNGISTVLADSSLTISGRIAGYLEQPRKVELQMNGQLGPEGNKTAASLLGLPPSIRAISNLNLLSSRLTLDREAKAAFQGEMQLPAGPRVTIDLVKTPQELSIQTLTVKDGNSDASISMNARENLLQIGFSGTLSNTTVNRLLIGNKLLTGPMEGKFNARLYLDTPDKSTVQGAVRISGLQLPVNLPVPTRIEDAVLEADGNRIDVKSGIISWDGSRLSLSGSVAITGDAYLVDMNAFADNLDLESLIKSREDFVKDTENSAQPDPGASKKVWDAPIRGTIHLRTQQLVYGKLAWNPVNADVVLNPGSIDVRLNQANLCGISTPGDITITRDGLHMALSPSAKDQDLESALACFFNKQHILSGSYTLTGNLTAGGKDGSLGQSLEGNVELNAKDGRIFRFNTFSKIISLLSITEFYRGVVPDLLHEGCEYHTIESKGKIKNGKLILSDSVLNGPCIKMVFRGEIDLVRQKVDVVALVAPLRTVERVVGAAPVMGKLLNEALVTLPVRITGDLGDPNVVLLSPSAVGEELFGVMKRVFKLPLTIFQPDQENQAAQKNTDSSKQGN
jgi:uncharacterized protein involved in outer membrane biogenesis